VLAFPSAYSAGITNLGYQVVWATLARRADLDVRRLFTDQGDPAHRDPELFGGAPLLSANPEPLAPCFDVMLLGDKALRTAAGW